MGNWRSKRSIANIAIELQSLVSGRATIHCSDWIKRSICGWDTAPSIPSTLRAAHPHITLKLNFIAHRPLTGDNTVIGMMDNDGRFFEQGVLMPVTDTIPIPIVLPKALPKRQSIETDDLDRAITSYGKALNATPKDSLARAALLSSLGYAFRSRYERTGSSDDLNRAISSYEKALNATPEDSPNCGALLTNLGDAFRRRFDRTGSSDDLDRAIKSYEEAVKVNHRKRSINLNNLGVALHQRFERAGLMDDLHRAIEVNQQALEMLPEDSCGHNRPLNNLGLAFQKRFTITSEIGDLDRAIELNQQAVDITSGDNPERFIYIYNLGIAHQNRFETTKSMENLRRAIDYKEQALKIMPVDSPSRQRTYILVSLGIALRRRFTMTRSMPDLDRAISLHEEAGKLMPEDDEVSLTKLMNALQNPTRPPPRLPPPMPPTESEIDLDRFEWKKLLTRDLSLADLRGELISIYMRRGNATDSKFGGSEGTKTDLTRFLLTNE
jgi:tetratricopeptide (TPR) repeat protein